ncbi:MAG: hypothetical protein GKR89_27875 [Candidatus Latescibacteria bacterium]|nr:hypothetical protein [Candidatus Latescibacterota bacterium]
MIIEHIEVIPLHMPYQPGLDEHLARSGLLNFANQVTLYRVQLRGGAVGWGDQMGGPTPIDQFIGQSALAGLKHIVHPGIQMACYDAVGRALDLPAHALMGRQVRPRVPMAYWTADLPPHLWAQHARKAVELGYRVYKFKCRPWWDPLEQIEAVQEAVPPGFTFWLDFNGHLRETRQALPVLQALSRYDCVGGFESPIPQRDAAGYRQLRAKIDRPIAAHFGSGCCHVRSVPGFDPGVPANQQIKQGLCDSFVLGGADIEQVRHCAAVLQEARRPFWIQVIGSGLRAYWVAHLASVCSQAILSNLAAHTIWEPDLVAPLPMEAGWLAVPQGPGLGAEPNLEIVEQVRQTKSEPPPRRLTTVVYADGQRHHYGNDRLRHETHYLGSAPGFTPGIRLETRFDDGSTDFADLFRRSQEAPVVENC